jgi:predicted nucleic acid-binding protein
MKCLDTDLLVAILRGDAEAEEKMRQLDEDGRNATTSINAFEIFYGAYKSKKRMTNIEGTKRLLSRLDVLSLNVEAAEKAGNFFADLELEGLQVEFRDVLVAASSLENHLALVTRNKRHYSRIVGLNVESW